jgi:hypothetical protein
MRAGRCGLGQTSPTLGVGGNLLCEIAQFGSFEFARVAHASRVLATVSRRRELLLCQASTRNSRLMRSMFRRDAESPSRTGICMRDACATQSDSLRCSSSRQLFASGRKPCLHLRQVKRNPNRSLSLQRVSIFRLISHRQA